MMPVSYERKGRVALITIEGRTELNLLAPDTVYLPLFDAFSQYEEDENAWCAVLTAVGTKAFSAGGDLKAYDRLEQGYRREVGDMLAGTSPERSLNTLIRGQVRIGKPIIFAINGLCLGAATALVLSYADIIYAAPQAKFGLPEIKWAIGGILGTKLQRFFPWPIAMELYLTGRLMDAEEAFRHGFVNYVVPQEQLLAAANTKAREIAEEMPPLNIRKVKEIMTADRAFSLFAAEQIEQLAKGVPRDHPDTREGIRAFVERRKPRYVGNKAQPG